MMLIIVSVLCQSDEAFTSATRTSFSFTESVVCTAIDWYSRYSIAYSIGEIFNDELMCLCVV
jgi:hypothetical protein